MRCIDTDGSTVLFCNFHHDRQAQSRSIHVGPQSTVKRLKHPLSFGHGNARPIVFHLYHKGMAVGVHQNPRRDDPGAFRRCGGVVNGVVYQIANHLFEQDRVAEYVDIGRCCVDSFIAKVQTFVHGTGERF